MAKVLDYSFAVSEFKLQSHKYVQFWTNSLGKGMNPLILYQLGVQLYHYSSSMISVGKHFGGRAASLGYKLLKGSIFYIKRI